MKILFQYKILAELVREGFVEAKNISEIKKILHEEGGSVLTIAKTRGLLNERSNG